MIVKYLLLCLYAIICVVSSNIFLNSGSNGPVKTYKNVINSGYLYLLRDGNIKLHEKYGLIDTKSAETVDIDISMVTNSNITTFHELLIKFMKKSIVYNHDKVGKSIMNDKFALISLHSWPIGYDTYVYTVTPIKIKSESIEFSLKSLNLRNNFLPTTLNVVKRIELNIKMKLLNKSLEITVTPSSIGISKKHVKNLVSIVRQYIETNFIDIIEMQQSRNKLSNDYNIESKKALKMKKNKKYDRIINPDKYKSKSSTVRNPSSSSSSSSSKSGGSGRYTPSASTRARREVKRG